jgi:uncharacterized protein (DUF952 family)
VARVANRFYRDTDELLVLCINASQLAHPLRDEPADTGELFPHIYGPINREAIVDVRQMERDTSGHWVFHARPS